jgi:hypothetical protein
MFVEGFSNIVRKNEMGALEFKYYYGEPLFCLGIFLRLISTSRYILGQCLMLSPERILPHLSVYYFFIFILSIPLCF